ncbi:hypothetical protein [Pseudomonas sp.]|uniref:hypothetical protein n=1 Tax=Pseudomonas sp. TaxID=306 RepID=UPI003D14AE62
MNMPAYLLSAGILIAALAALQQPTTETRTPQHNTASGIQSIQRLDSAHGARVLTLSGSEISPSQPQRWVF